VGNHTLAEITLVLGNYYTLVWIPLWLDFMVVVAVAVGVTGVGVTGPCIIKWQKVFHSGESQGFKFHFVYMKACFVKFKLVTTRSCIGSVHSIYDRF
jgi:hypothetical protein